MRARRLLVLGAAIAAAFAGTATIAAGGSSKVAVSSCQLGNGIRHVIEITFDNTHFNRDNPNVLSDLEQMPALQNFITSQGTMLSNNYTPLLAHTADDSLTNYSGLYGDRHGQGIGNTYETYNSGGTVTPKSSFAYWTGTYGLDPFPNMPYSANVPAAGSPSKTPPAPWVPFARAGCSVGDVSTANMVLENLVPDLANIFGPSSPEVQQYNADPNGFKDQEVNDYEGLGVHCAQGDTFCSTAMATKYGQSSPSNTAVTDVLPDEPGGYSGFQGLFGHKYLQPQLKQAATSGGNRVVGGHTYPIYDAAGNLVDLNGTEIQGGFTHTPGFPGFGPISAAQSLAYAADMQETGVPVTYAYISDAHEKKPGESGCSNSGTAQGPADPCYKANLAAYNSAFTTFFQRLADDGINASNTLFVFTADEGDHFAGANVGRAVDPTASCTGTPLTTGYTCSYPNGKIGEQQVDIHGLLLHQLGNSTPFYNEPQGNSIFITGNPGPNDTATRQLERDFANATANDTYDGGVPENISQWQADPTVEQLLHFVNADPNRTPSFTVFPKGDYFFTSGTQDTNSAVDGCPAGTNQSNAAANCTFINKGFAWDHGYYSQEIDNTWLGLVGPGVANKGVDGFTAGQGPSSAGSANSNLQLVTKIANPGTWADHTDTRPTIMALTGLKDDYVGDGRVLTEDLTTTPGKTGDAKFQPLAVCYKQLDSSVGRFGTDMLLADTAALKTGSSSDDSNYQLVSSEIKALGAQRDALATKIKGDLFNAEFNNTAIPGGNSDLAHCNNVLNSADKLATVASGAPAVHAKSAGAASLTCANATFAGTTDNLTVPAGTFCIASGTVNKDLTVGSNALLISFTGLSVGHDLKASSNAELDLFSGTVSHDLSADKPSAIDLGFGGTLNVGHDLTISGSNSPNGFFVDVCATKVDHDLKISGIVDNDEIEVGDDEFCNPSAGSSSAGHDLSVTGSNAFFIDVGNNSAGHDLTVNGDKAGAGGYIDVSDNTVSHDASCGGNNPALSKDGADDHANSAGHNNTCG